MLHQSHHVPVCSGVNVEANVLKVIVGQHLPHLARAVGRQPQDKGTVLILSRIILVHLSITGAGSIRAREPNRKTLKMKKQGSRKEKNAKPSKHGHPHTMLGHTLCTPFIYLS